MNFKKFAKLFMLFTLMNLIGTVVWAGENSADNTTCEPIVSLVNKPVMSDATASTAQPAPATAATTVK